MIGLPRHALADNGALALAVHDSQREYTLIDYELHRLANGHARPDPEPAGTFLLDSVRRLEFAPFPQVALALSDKDLVFLRVSEDHAEIHPYMPGRGLIFLDAAVAGADPRRTAAFLWQDRAAGTFNLGVAEAREKLAPLWAKSWSHSLTTLAISQDGNWIAVAHANGNLSLLDRARKPVWDYAGGGANVAVSLAVDSHGNVIAADVSGGVRRHDPEGGAVVWRAELVGPGANRPAAGRPVLRVAADRETRVVGAAVGNPPGGEASASHGRYFVLDGATGRVSWDDALSSRPTGLSVAPSAEYLAISTQAGALFFSVALGAQAQEEAPPSPAPNLVATAKKAIAASHYFAALPILAEALDSDPTSVEAATLYEETTWQVRELVMDTTTQPTEDSLARVETALKLLPFNEKLTARRNALARIIAGKYCEQAQTLLRGGMCEEAIDAYYRAIDLDPSLIEARQAIGQVKERIVVAFVQQAHAAMVDERWDDARALLEKAGQVRPGAPEIAALLTQIERDEAYSHGMRYYGAQRYPEAAFQFKRVLSLDPGHMDALLHLNQAEAQLRKAAQPEDPVGSAIERFNRPH